MAGKSGKKRTGSFQKKRPRSLPKLSERQPNAHDVWIRLIDAFYNLAQSGNLFLLILFAFLAAFLIVVIKIPGDELPGLLAGLGRFFSREKFYFFPLGGTIGVCLLALFRQRRIYTAEIRRLTDERKRVIHGIESGELHTLEHHNSSGTDVESEPFRIGKNADDD